MNWVFEGSNNEKEWFVLDKRINYIENNQSYNDMMENERLSLMDKGATTSWASIKCKRFI